MRPHIRIKNIEISISFLYYLETPCFPLDQKMPLVHGCGIRWTPPNSAAQSAAIALGFPSAKTDPGSRHVH